VAHSADVRKTGVGGGLFGAVACGQSDDRDLKCTGAVLGIGLLGAGLGGLTGLLIGAQFSERAHDGTGRLYGSVAP
jgi:hypothetical protein